ncbi:flagellar basal body-associated FliL family protein [Jannaschia donghaensis]|uniref:Flagellar protein FliL n=1 Tax=Jannaschia donghaensis TaxID=420998 RepID=A0A0M6YII4_9RHOB|nr:flagellar basal body-associated FliL family protein [Jannaschia donghaensis]CTQ49087.1 flagellar basal body-associated protein FliL [Jannaschia donghaensis]
MADSEDPNAIDSDKPKKGLGKIGWLIAVVLALGLGGGGFYATHSGLLLGSPDMASDPNDGSDNGPAAPIYLELDPMMISVGDAGSIRQMRFRAVLQLEKGHANVAALQPRILDIFSTYLRAVSVTRLEDPTALLDLRAQLLRRVQLLAGDGSVSDLLIIDFVIT